MFQSNIHPHFKERHFLSFSLLVSALLILSLSPLIQGKSLNRQPENIFDLPLFGRCLVKALCLTTDEFDLKSGEQNFFSKNIVLSPSAPELEPTGFTNAVSISIPASGSTVSGAGAAGLYSSNISVSGLAGTITDLNVKINGFSHTFPNDVALLLVSPGGVKFILQSDVGGKADVNNVSYTFDDQAAAAIGTTAFPAANSSVKPSSVGNDDLLLSPAPPAPYNHPAPAGAATLNGVFGGSNPNGTWQLFVFDFFAGNSGAISGGWSLSVTTTGGAILSPAITSLNPTTVISGGGGFELTVNGSNFNTDSIVRWNGQNRASTYVSASQLKAQISASDILTAGQYQTTVINPQTGRISNAVNFSVTPCSYSLGNSSQTVAGAGGGGSVNVSTTNGCDWTALSNNGWLTVTPESGLTGSGTVQFDAAANQGPARTGTINIAGQVFTVIQESGCAYSLSAANASFAAAGGTGSFTINSGAGCPWTVSSNNSWITLSSPAAGTGSAAVSFSVEENTGQTPRNAVITAGGRTFAVSQTGRPATANGSVMFDFDGDRKADLSVFRPSSEVWHLMKSQAGYTSLKFGLAADKLTPADFDGDGRTDIAVWREGAVSTFYILNSSDNTLRQENFGIPGDDPRVVGDWDGDGKADPAVYRAGTRSFFYYRGSLNNPNGNVTFIDWGAREDKAVRGDFDGDGKFDSAVFRPSNGVWYILQSSNNQARFTNWGISSDKLVPADFDGDGKTDPAVYRDGVWYILRSSDGQASYNGFGISTDLPVPADYDGDGAADLAVYRGGVWYISNSTSGFAVQVFGTDSDKPLANTFVH